MNKKFSTLAVAAMLASAFTAYAGPGDGDVVSYLTEGNTTKSYQLHAVYGLEQSEKELGYLTLNGNDQLTFVKDDADSKFSLEAGGYTRGASLWCVSVTRENDGKNPIFDFTNKAYGKVLDVTVGGYNTSGAGWSSFTTNSVANALNHIGGEIAGWEFTPILGKGGNSPIYMFGDTDLADATHYALRSYVDQNKVATLVYDGGIKVAVMLTKPPGFQNVFHSICSPYSC